MSAEKIILTREGYEKLFEELKFLKTKKRREVAKQLEHARSYGDLRENAEYETAKEAKQQLESRIAGMESRLALATVIDTRDLPKDKAYFGATLEIKNIETGDILRYTLVAQDEADLTQGKISVGSPIGKGLVGKSENDVVEIQVPAGKVKYQILKITRNL